MKSKPPKSKRLTTEVKDLKKKVRSLEDELKKSQDVSSKHLNILNEFYSKVKPIVAPPEKTEDKGTETVALVSSVSDIITYPYEMRL